MLSFFIYMFINLPTLLMHSKYKDNMKQILPIFAISTLTFSSCTQVSSPEINTHSKVKSSAVKPTVIKLNSKSVDQPLVKLRWSGTEPSMDMSQTNSGSGWQPGIKKSDGVYSFAQGKFYGLTLDFNRSTFIETGFDGGWLPEVKGSWTAVR